MLFLLLFLSVIHSGFNQEAGDPCKDEYTNTRGICTPARECDSAKHDYQNNGIRPTFCSFDFNNALVCCRDRTNILQTGTYYQGNNRVQSSNSNNRRRLSDRKCEEYSRGVVEEVGFIALIPDPEQMSVSAAKCDYTGVELIVGGENANQGEFPHMAAVGWVDLDEKYDFQCGGSLISSRFVLTAGHCISNPRMRIPEPTVVRLGDQNLDSSVNDGASPVDVLIKTIHKHPEYYPPSKYNDIALLELVADVDFSAEIRPACLWTQTSYAGHKKALATGWGVNDTRTRKPTNELQKVSLSLLADRYCEELLSDRNRNWKDGYISSQMCAGELRGGKDTCQGDSGSPLQVASKDNKCIFYVMGVTSFGRRCAQSGKPAIYTRVSSYLDWIESVVWPGE